MFLSANEYGVQEWMRHDEQEAAEKARQIVWVIMAKTIRRVITKGHRKLLIEWVIVGDWKVTAITLTEGDKESDR
jgi:hypothetical protein